MERNRVEGEGDHEGHGPGGSSGPPGPSGAAVVPATLPAACGYWRRRGIPTEPEQVAAAPGVPLLLLAVLAAAGGEQSTTTGARSGTGSATATATGTGIGTGAADGADGGAVLLPRPAAPWHAAQARLLGRPVHPVPVPAECGGVPDPVALLEAVRRVRRDGDRPRALVLSLVDDCTGTAPPPELLAEVCEVASGEGLLIVSDETWRDTSHDPHDTVRVSPAEMLHGAAGPAGPSGASGADAVVVIAGVGGALPPPVPQVGIARFAGTPRGRAVRDSVARALAALDARLPPAADAGAADALAEPAPLRARRAAVSRAQGVLVTALYRAFTDAGALCRPPHAARHLYADLEPVRAGLAARGIRDAPALEAELARRLGPFVAGGHRFGDESGALRVRVSGELLTGPPTAGSPGSLGSPGSFGSLGSDDDGRGGASEVYGAAGVPSLTPPDPLESPDVTRALHRVRSELADLTAYGVQEPLMSEQHHD